MRRALTLLALLLAGCAAPEEAPPAPPALHYTDCARNADAATCKSPTEGTPLVVRREPSDNASRVGLVLRNNGTAPLAFDAHPPPVQVYLWREGAWAKVALAAGDAPGRALAPGEDLAVELHYGRPEGAGARDVAYAPQAEPEAWPEGAYRFCASAHPEGEDAWVRGCASFRVRAR